MEVKPTYNYTEFGEIPMDWEIVPMGTLLTEFRGGASLKPSDFNGSGIKVLPKGGVGRTGWLNIEDSNQQYCSPHYAMTHTRNQVDDTFTIVVLRDLVPSGPSIGLIVQIRNREIFILAQGVYGFKSNNKVVPKYLVHVSNTHWYRRLMNSIMVGSTQVHITNTAFKLVCIPLPPIKEQKAIAEALSDADALIESLEQLITKKRQIKQGAMQELLTAQKRLPGFGGAWILKSIGSFSEFVTKGATPTTYGFNWEDDGILFLRSECVSEDGLDLNQSMFISKGAHRTIIRSEVRADDILITITGNVGRVVHLKSDFGYANINQHIARIRVKDPCVHSGFVYHWLSQASTRAYYISITTGQAYPQISLKQVRETNIPLPSKLEQEAIASILSDMDAEIEALEAKLAKARQIKQGMMQELLTGRIRLI